MSKEFPHFLRISRGPLSELETLIVLSQKLGLLEAALSDDLLGRIDRITALINGLIAGLYLKQA